MSKDASTSGRVVLMAAAAAVAFTVAVLAGLRVVGTQRDCTLIGSNPSNVSVKVEGAGWAVDEFCVDGECEKGDRVDVSADPGEYSFRASLVAGDGTVTERSGSVTSFEVWPNGEGCGSRRSYGQVMISADGTVTTVDPWIGRH